MSGKINVKSIIFGHFATLRNEYGKPSWVDFAIFLLVPAVFFTLSICFEFNLSNEIISLLVNFGAIFTALLLSVLVLVYDQESKLDDRQEKAKQEGSAGDIFHAAKKELLGDLYLNISFSIVSSLILIGLCFAHSVIELYAKKPPIVELGFAEITTKLIITPLVVFLVVNLLLTIVMLVKRLHALLIMNRTG